MGMGVLGRGILTILTMTILTTCGFLKGRRGGCMSGFFRFESLLITLEISNFAREEGAAQPDSGCGGTEDVRRRTDGSSLPDGENLPHQSRPLTALFPLFLPQTHSLFT